MPSLRSFFPSVSLPFVRAVQLGALVTAAACSSAAEPREEAPGSALPPASEPGAPTPTPPSPTGTTPAPPKPTATTVRVHYAGRPGTLSLRGGGGPLSWEKSAALTPAGPGLYTWTSAELASETELKPMLGEVWSRGPNYKVKPGATLDIYPRFFESHGSVERKYPSFTSTNLPSTRGLWVYLPPTYLENTEARFPVLYMHHGQNLFSSATAFGGNEWKVDETLDAGAEDGTIREVIVVGVENTANRMVELTPSVDPGRGAGGDADKYLAMIASEVKPLVDTALRTLPGRETTALMGSSLGGLVSAYAGVKRADVFGIIGAMSPSTWWDGRMILAQVDAMKTQAVKPLRIYVDSGDGGAGSDDAVNTKELAARYRGVGYVDAKDFMYVLQPGALHNEIYWAQRLPAALRFLLGGRD